MHFLFSLCKHDILKRQYIKYEAKAIALLIYEMHSEICLWIWAEINIVKYLFFPKFRSFSLHVRHNFDMYNRFIFLYVWKSHIKFKIALQAFSLFILWVILKPSLKKGKRWKWWNFGWMYFMNAHDKRDNKEENVNASTL